MGSHDDHTEGSLPGGPAILFCPADRPDRYQKALASADAVILDLEDAVAPERKAAARQALRDALPNLPAERTVVRINSPRTFDGQLDLELVQQSHLRHVMVPKVEDPGEIEALTPLASVALCETAKGVEAAPDIAAARGCAALMWGGEDLTADIGGRSSRGADGRYLPHVNYARSRVLVAAAAARVGCWDGVFLDIVDVDGLKTEAEEAVAMGFVAKVAIHPIQTAVIREAYRPSEAQLAWSAKLLAALENADSGVVNFEGRMVDGPAIAMAQAIVAASTSQEQ